MVYSLRCIDRTVGKGEGVRGGKGRQGGRGVRRVAGVAAEAVCEQRKGRHLPARPLTLS